MADLNEILNDTIQALEELKRSGVTHVEVSRATIEELGKPMLAATSGHARTTATGAVALQSARPQPRSVVADLAGIEERVKACTKCSELARCRTNVVFGVGNPHAELMFIGEAPGRDEDLEGEPFVGRAGQLLTKIIQAMGFARHEVYIANVLKCRPPENRQPLPNEVENCLPFLKGQIDLIKPKLMVGLGATAMKALLGDHFAISKTRGNWHDFHGIPIMPTFHPAYLLRNPPAKKEVWQDMQAVLARLGRKVPKS